MEDAFRLGVASGSATAFSEELGTEEFVQRFFLKLKSHVYRGGKKVKITELLTRDTIHLNIESKEKENVIDEMVTVLDKAGRLNDREAYKAPF